MTVFPLSATHDHRLLTMTTMLPPPTSPPPDRNHKNLFNKIKTNKQLPAPPNSTLSGSLSLPQLMPQSLWPLLNYKYHQFELNTYDMGYVSYYSLSPFKNYMYTIPYPLCIEILRYNDIDYDIFAYPDSIRILRLLIEKVIPYFRKQNPKRVLNRFI